jgi:hypothetical protein
LYLRRTEQFEEEYIFVFLASAYLSRKAFDERRWATFPGIEFGWPIEYDQSEKKEWDEIFTQ